MRAMEIARMILACHFLVMAGSSALAGMDEEKAAQRQAAEALLASLDSQLAAGQKAIVIPPGDYRFDSPARHVQFAGLSNVSIDATGATFWFDPRTGKGVRFENCRAVTLRGLTVDSDPLPWFQGTITAIDKDAMTVDFVSEPGFLVPKGELLKQASRVIFFDGETGTELPIVDDRVLQLEDLGEGRARIAKFNTDRIFKDVAVKRAVRIGDRLVIRIEGAGGGNIVLRNCSSMTLEGVTNHGAGGFAFHEASGAGGNSYLGCKLIRRPGTNRLMASSADAFHSYLMRKGPRVERCEFSHAGDDLIAIHGFFGIVLERRSEREIIVAAPFGRLFEQGSRLTIFNLDGQAEAVVARVEELTDSALIGKAKALSQTLLERKVRIRDLNDVRVFRVLFESDVVAGEFDLVSSGDYCGRGAIVRDNHLHDGHVRGVLAKTEDLLVERNRIERIGHGGIVIEPEGYWLEGPLTRRVCILDNTLSEIGWGSFDRVGFGFAYAGIHVGAYLGQRLFPRSLVVGEFNFEVEICGNAIRQSAGPAIFVTNTVGLQIVGNSIEAPFAAGHVPGFYDWSRLPVPPRPELDELLRAPFRSILILDSKGVTVEDNRITDPPPFLRP